jgi:3',5'-cyclic AMP phosphodiesterase CpdA
MSRTVVHLSDIHFGKADLAIVGPLVEAVHALRPDVVAVSGDLTQRARAMEFQQAREFLDRLPAPVIVVPGNHDVPLYNLYNRFVQRFERYHRYIAVDSEPMYSDEEIALVGINTARSLAWKGGRVGYGQIARVKEKLSGVTSGIVKIVVTHHPFELPDGFSERDVVGRSAMAMNRLAECDADVLLSGHLHVTNVTGTVKRYRIHGHCAIVVQAGTAASTRRRGEVNSFNSLVIRGNRIEVTQWVWLDETKAFVSRMPQCFAKTVHGWFPAA